MSVKAEGATKFEFTVIGNGVQETLAQVQTLDAALDKLRSQKAINIDVNLSKGAESFFKYNKNFGTTALKMGQNAGEALAKGFDSVFSGKKEGALSKTLKKDQKDALKAVNEQLKKDRTQLEKTDDLFDKQTESVANRVKEIQDTYAEFEKLRQNPTQMKEAVDLGENLLGNIDSSFDEYGDLLWQKNEELKDKVTKIREDLIETLNTRHYDDNETPEHERQLYYPDLISDEMQDAVDRYKQNYDEQRKASRELNANQQKEFAENRKALEQRVKQQEDLVKQIKNSESSEELQKLMSDAGFGDEWSSRLTEKKNQAAKFANQKDQQVEAIDRFLENRSQSLKQLEQKNQGLQKKKEKILSGSGQSLWDEFEEAYADFQDSEGGSEKGQYKASKRLAAITEKINEDDELMDRLFSTDQKKVDRLNRAQDSANDFLDEYVSSGEHNISWPEITADIEKIKEESTEDRVKAIDKEIEANNKLKDYYSNTSSVAEKAKEAVKSAQSISEANDAITDLQDGLAQTQKKSKKLVNDETSSDFQNSLSSMAIKEETPTPSSVSEDGSISLNFNPALSSVLSDLDSLKSKLSSLTDSKYDINIDVDTKSATEAIDKIVNRVNSKANKEAGRQAMAALENPVEEKDNGTVTVDSNIPDLESKLKELTGHVTFETNIEEDIQSKLNDLKGHISFESDIEDVLAKAQEAHATISDASKVKDANLDTSLKIDGQKQQAPENSLEAVRQQISEKSKAIGDIYRKFKPEYLLQGTTSLNLLDQAVPFLDVMDENASQMDELAKAYPKEAEKWQANKEKAIQAVNQATEALKYKQDSKGVSKDDFLKDLKKASAEEITDTDFLDKWRAEKARADEAYRQAQLEEEREAKKKEEQRKKRGRKKTKATASSVAESSTAETSDKSGLTLSGELQKGENAFSINVTTQGVDEARESLSSLTSVLSQIKEATGSPIDINISMSDDTKELLSAGGAKTLKQFEESGGKLASSFSRGMVDAVGQSAGGGQKKIKGTSLVGSFLQQEEARAKELKKEVGLASDKRIKETYDALQKYSNNFSEAYSAYQDKSVVDANKGANAQNSASMLLAGYESYSQEELDAFKKALPQKYQDLQKKRAEAFKLLNQAEVAKTGGDIDAVPTDKLLSESLTEKISNAAEKYRSKRTESKSALDAYAKEEANQAELAIRQANVKAAQETKKRLESSKNDFETNAILKDFASSIATPEMNADSSKGGADYSKNFSSSELAEEYNNIVNAANELSSPELEIHIKVNDEEVTTSLNSIKETLTTVTSGDNTITLDTSGFESALDDIQKVKQQLDQFAQQQQEKIAKTAEEKETASEVQTEKTVSGDKTPDISTATADKIIANTGEITGTVTAPSIKAESGEAPSVKADSLEIAGKDAVNLDDDALTVESDQFQPLSKDLVEESRTSLDEYLNDVETIQADRKEAAETLKTSVEDWKQEILDVYDEVLDLDQQFNDLDHEYDSLYDLPPLPENIDTSDDKAVEQWEKEQEQIATNRQKEIVKAQKDLTSRLAQKRAELMGTIKSWEGTASGGDSPWQGNISDDAWVYSLKKEYDEKGRNDLRNAIENQYLDEAVKAEKRGEPYTLLSDSEYKDLANQQWEKNVEDIRKAKQEQREALATQIEKSSEEDARLVKDINAGKEAIQELEQPVSSDQTKQIADNFEKNIAEIQKETGQESSGGSNPQQVVDDLNAVKASLDSFGSDTKTISIEVSPPVADIVSDLESLSSKLQTLSEPVKIDIDLDGDAVQEKIDALTEKTDTKAAKETAKDAVDLVSDEAKRTADITKVDNTDEDTTLKLKGELTSVTVAEGVTVKVPVEATDVTISNEGKEPLKVQAEAEIDGNKVSEEAKSTPANVTLDTNIEQIQAQLNSMTGKVTFETNIKDIQKQLDNMQGKIGEGSAEEKPAKKMEAEVPAPEISKEAVEELSDSVAKSVDKSTEKVADKVTETVKEQIEPEKKKTNADTSKPEISEKTSSKEQIPPAKEKVKADQIANQTEQMELLKSMVEISDKNISSLADRVKETLPDTQTSKPKATDTKKAVADSLAEVPKSLSNFLAENNNDTLKTLSRNNKDLLTHSLFDQNSVAGQEISEFLNKAKATPANQIREALKSAVTQYPTDGASSTSQKTATRSLEKAAKAFTDASEVSGSEKAWEKGSYKPKSAFTRKLYDSWSNELAEQISSGNIIPDKAFTDLFRKKTDSLRVLDQKYAQGLDKKDDGVAALTKELTYGWKKGIKDLNSQYGLRKNEEILGYVSADQAKRLYGYDPQTMKSGMMNAQKELLSDSLQHVGDEVQKLHVSSNSGEYARVKYTSEAGTEKTQMGLRAFTGANGEQYYGITKRQSTIVPNELMTDDIMPGWTDKAKDRLESIMKAYSDPREFIQSNDLVDAFNEHDDILTQLFHDVNETGMTQDRADKLLDKVAKNREKQFKEVSKGLEADGYIGDVGADFFSKLDEKTGRARSKYLNKTLEDLYSSTDGKNASVKVISERDDSMIVERRGYDGRTTTNKVSYSPYTDLNGETQYALKSKQVASDLPQSAIKNWGSNVISKFKSLTEYLAGMYLADQAMQEISKGIQFVSDTDKAMTNIGMTMDATASQLNNLKTQSIEVGKTLKTDSSNVIEAATLYANANETADSILERAKPTVMLANAAGTTATEASNYIQAVNFGGVCKVICVLEYFEIAGKPLESSYHSTWETRV